MASIAAGLSLAGKIPFISSYAVFSPGRNWEQIRTTIALQNTNVKIGGAHAGVSVGPDGATHQAIEDIATMRAIPRMTVIVPADARETQKATVAAAQKPGPVYLRFAREKSPVFTTPKTPFKIGRGEVYRFGKDVTIFGAGPVLYEALLAAETLSKTHGIEARVINLHTIKPLDEAIVVRAAKETGALVTVEEANVIGGLGGAVAEVVCANKPVPIERIGVQDHFAESGDPKLLLEVFGLTAPSIVLACLRAIERKHGRPVSAIPSYIEQAQKLAQTKARTVMKEALSRTPKKWGGKLPDQSLKSRKGG
jgi:transketolase